MDLEKEMKKHTVSERSIKNNNLSDKKILKKILIVGGVAGGATTAARLRRMDENCSITIFERGKYVSFANCGLPYYIGGTIKHRGSLLVQTARGFKNRFNIDARTQSDVFRINREKKYIEVKDLKTDKIYPEEYDYLVLSTGALPVRPPLPGIDSEKIFTLRDVPDSDRIKEYIDNNSLTNAVIIGGGFIGLEMAENLHDRGLSVSIVEMENQVLAPLDFEMASIVHRHLREKNVKLYLNNKVTGFKNEGSKINVVLENKEVLPADMVILSIGVKPDSKLAVEAGLNTGINNSIKVNKYLQTSDVFIFALGDAAENNILGQQASVYLAGPANKQGRIAADNIACLINGVKKLKEYKGAIGTGIAKVFNLTSASTGFSEKYCKKENISSISSITHSGSHAGYYPGAANISIKLIFSGNNGKVLGAQAVGNDGVDKRIDIIASVIKMKGTIYDLAEIEHAYAPPFSSAKDPVNIAGYVAENILTDKVKIISWKELQESDPAETLLLDVRTTGEYESGTIKNAHNIPVDEFRNRMSEINELTEITREKNKKIVVFCRIGLRAYLAYRILVQNGFENVFNLSGGYLTFSTALSI